MLRLAWPGSILPSTLNPQPSTLWIQSPAMKRLLIAILLTAFAPSLFAWGEAGHYITNDAATYGLPNDMPAFFYEAFPDLVYLAYDPDRWPSGRESLEAVNAPDHLFDYE